MADAGADCVNVDSLSGLSFESILGQIAEMAGEQSGAPLKGLVSITAILLICSMISAYKGSLSQDTGAILNTAGALCIGCAVALPAVSLISQANAVITASSNLMLAYVPVMAALLAAGGSIAGAGSYYAAVLAAGEGVLQLSSRAVSPFLNMFLGLGIVSGVTPNINLGGFSAMLGKALKWLLGFSMTVFTAVLGIRQVLSGAADTVSSRAVRFAVSSFVPIVGSALSDAYRTVQGSVGLLKSGLGVFVIIALGFTFLPLLIQGVMWSFSLWLGKAAAEALSLDQSAKLLGALGSVMGAVISVMLCVMTVYIISTAAVFTVGGELH